MKRLIMMATVVLAAGTVMGCVISIEDDHHHPDRCYDCHNSWELDRVTVGVRCAEFEITVVSSGYWYKPVGTDDTQKQFHLLKAAEPKTIVGPAPAGL